MCHKEEKNVYTYLYILYIYIYMYIYVTNYICKYMRLCTCINLHTYLYLLYTVCVHICDYVCMYIYCICAYIYIYIITYVMYIKPCFLLKNRRTNSPIESNVKNKCIINKCIQTSVIQRSSISFLTRERTHRRSAFLPNFSRHPGRDWDTNWV